MHSIVGDMKHSVLITGSSSGIGRATALHLAQTGHQVFAGVRKLEDGSALKAQSEAITPVVIDVAKSQTIQSCLSEVSRLRDPKKPFSLINNAGVAVAGPIEVLKVSELRKQFDVNFFGLIETTQALLPIIRETRGRVFNISSISGRVSSPFLGAYSASKFALEALSDSLRYELAPFGVPVILVEPGPIQSEIWTKGFEHKNSVPDFYRADCFGLYEARLNRFVKIVEGIAQKSIPASEVARRVAQALEADTPPIRLVVAALRSRIEMHCGEWIPSRIYDKLVSHVLKA